MKFLSNAHTHTHFCDGKDAPRAMVAAAQVLGFVSLGFSGHARQDFDFAYSMSRDQQQRYMGELRKLQEELSTAGESPRLWVGLEQDGLVPAEYKEENKTQFDYRLGSTHYVAKEFQGAPVAVDGDFVALKAYVIKMLDGDWMAMVRQYFAQHVDTLLRDRPEIIGHFDLVRKAAVVGRFFDENESTYRRIALDALEKALGAGSVMEVNTGGMARGYMSEPYPSRELLGAWRELGGKVTLTSDCHDAAYLDFGLSEAMGMLKKLGFRRVERLGRGESLWEQVEL